MRKLLRRFVPVLMLLATAPAAWAASPLADRLPGDAVAYVGWSGAEALGPAYEKSNLKGVVTAAELGKLFDAIMQKAAAEAGADPKKLEGFKLVTQLGESVAKYPTAVYFGGVLDMKADKPTPKLAAVMQCGAAEAERLRGQLQKAIDADTNRQPDDPKPSVKVVGDYLLVIVGDGGDIEKRLSGIQQKGPSLAEIPQFIAAETQTGKDAAIRVFVNTESALKLVDEVVGVKAPPMGKEMWPKVVDALGIEGLKYAAMAGGFDGPNWKSQVYVAMAGKRAGLLSFLDNPPVTPEALKLIPKSATWAGVIRFNGDRLLKDIRDAAGRIDDNAQRRMDMFLQMFTDNTGIDLQKDILTNLQDEFVCFTTPDATGSSFKGLTLACKAKDGAALEKAITDLERLANTFLRGDNGPKFTTETRDDVTVHTVTFKNGGYSWAVHSDTFIIALTPQAVQVAANHVAKKGPGLDENPVFVESMKRLGVPRYSSFAFCDLAKFGPESYGLLTHLVEEAQRQNPDGKITFTMPTYEKLRPFMTTRAMAAWSDKDGFHMVSSEPFPGSGFFSGEGAIQLWVQKSLADARATARNTVSASNLRQVGMAIHLYAADNEGRLPADLGVLLKNQTIPPEVLLRDRQSVPAGWRAKSADEKATWAEANSDYVYVGKGKVSEIKEPAKTVLAYEKYTAGKTGKVSVLFVDGHVESLAIDDLEAKLK